MDVGIMPDTRRFAIMVSAADGADAAIVGEFALTLRRGLGDLGPTAGAAVAGGPPLARVRPVGGRPRKPVARRSSAWERGSVTELTIHRLDRRPDLIERIYELDDGWPEFMSQDPVANALFGRIAREFPHTCVAAVDAGGTLVARGRSVPFAFGGQHRAELPDGGLDRVLVWAFRDVERGTAPNVASAVEIAVDPAHRGAGLSHRMLAALSGAVRDAGLSALVAPVRPNRKPDPHTPMTEYAYATRDDGLPVDAWLRVHVRAGGRIVKVAPASMVMPGSLAEWREWTGLPFDVTGDVSVPGALVPVRCDVAHDYAVYVEPNVWVWHDLG